ncbi:MAG: preprotein translocase subunit SecY [bacterium]|nr:preprotein translocase subunit SecY [bacterium]
MLGSFIHAFKVPDIRKKLLIVGGLLLVFRILAAIPVPGVDPLQLSNLLGGSDLFGFLNIFSGGALSNLSIMMLGVSPYITATIIMQLLTMIFPGLKVIYYEEGALGRAKFNRISRYLTVPLAALQGYGLLNLLISQNVLAPLSASGMVRDIIVITAGALILMWIGELITEQKIGNGTSLIIFAGIVSGLPIALQTAFINYSPELITSYIVFAIASLAVIAGVVFISEGERKIPVVYSKRVRGNKMFGGSTSYLPLKVNQAGVIPIIFAISILLFPQFLAQILSIFSSGLSIKLQGLVSAFLNNQLWYGLFYFSLVVVFTYFYTAITFNPEEISKNLQQNGGFIPGMRPGEHTTSFLKKTTGRITLFGAVFLGLIAVLPIITQFFTNTKSLTIGGTALLIVVSVALETARQLQSQLAVREYDNV